MALHFDISGQQINGARDYQEDAFLVTQLGSEGEEKGALVIVADGMGGHAAGNVASNMAVQAFSRTFAAHFPPENLANIPETLKECVQKANAAIKETVKETAALSGMGCTMVGVFLMSGRMWWASVGDSHLYLVRDKKLQKLNADHSYGGFIARMQAEGKAIQPDPKIARNMLMSALTGGDINMIDVSAQPIDLRDKDRIVVASDGLDTLNHESIARFALGAATAKDGAEFMLKAVTDARKPRQDNTTAVQVIVAEKKAGPTVVIAQPAPEEKKGAPVGLIVGGLILAVGGVLAADHFLKLGILSKPATQTASADTKKLEQVTKKLETVAEKLAESKDKEESKDKPKEAAAPAPAAVIARAAPANAATVQSFRDNLKSGVPGPELVTIPSGEFMMGNASIVAPPDERPQHKVTLREFAVMRHEVTYAQFETFAKATGRKLPERSEVDPKVSPVVNVTWQDAVDYAGWLSEQTDQVYRLPSEAEWEYLARATTSTIYWWGDTLEQNRAHCTGCGVTHDARKPAPVGSFAPNPFGVFDTAGNVSEWTMDCHNKDYSRAREDGSAMQTGDCSHRIVRGGSFANTQTGITNSKRDKQPATSAQNHIGFRLVREK